MKSLLLRLTLSTYCILKGVCWYWSSKKNLKTFCPTLHPSLVQPYFDNCFPLLNGILVESNWKISCKKFKTVRVGSLRVLYMTLDQGQRLISLNLFLSIVVQCSGIIFPMRQKQHRRFPNLKANLPLCHLLDRFDSLICICVYFKLKWFLIKTPTNIILFKSSYIRLYCIHFYVINYSLNCATFVNNLLLLFFCNACPCPMPYLKTSFCWLCVVSVENKCVDLTRWAGPLVDYKTVCFFPLKSV